MWHLYQSLVVDRFRGAANTADWDEWRFWLNALVQHYGPGTRFLDVTHSIAVAIWFASHKARPSDLRAVPGSGNELGDATDVLVDFKAFAYERHAATGYLYVLDVYPKGEGSEELGMLLDIAIAPKPFSQSARVLAQAACLVGVGQETDLMPFVVSGRPLEISPSLSGAVSIEWPTERIYPPPDVDTWYADLLALPVGPRFEPSSGSLYITNPLRIPVYVPSDPQLLPQYLNRTVAYRPFLYHPWLLSSRHDLVPEETDRRMLERATRILLQGPILHSTPLPDDPHWNDEILSSAARDTAPVNGQWEESGLSVTLRNVFVDFSVLDTDWSAASKPPGHDMVRAAWLTIADDGQMTLWLFAYNPATRKHMSRRALSIYYRADQRRLRFGTMLEDGGALEDVTIGMVIRACLTLLCHLDTEPVVSPYPIAIRDDEAVAVPILYKACRLVGPSTHGYYVAMSDAETPYLGTTGLTMEHASELLTLTTPHGFGAVCGDHIAEAIFLERRDSYLSLQQQKPWWKFW
jgi:hypothetical protein